MRQTKHPALAAARDKLLAWQGHHERAVGEFEWPDVGDRFNWGHDWFDAFARGNDKPGLVIVEQDGNAASYSFAELVDSSDQVAPGCIARVSARATQCW